MSRGYLYSNTSCSLIVLLFVVDFINAPYVYLLPEEKLLYSDETPTITLCIRDKERDLCGEQEERQYKNAFCLYWMILDGNNSSKNNSLIFTNFLFISNILPGVYHFLCRLHKTAPWTSTQRIILSKRATYVDCPPLPKMFELHSAFRDIPRLICCPRSPINSSWLRTITGKVNLCHQVNCSVVGGNGLFFIGALLHSEPHRITPTSRYTIKCTTKDEVFEDYFFIVDSFANTLFLNIHPDSSVLMKSMHHTTIAVCTSWRRLGNCLKDASSVDCYMTGTSLTGRKTKAIHFKNSVSVADLEEGTYKVSCHSSEFRLSATVIRHVLHQGNYVWSCDTALRIIYLAHGPMRLHLCEWTANVSTQWRQSLVKYGLEQRPFTCYSRSGGMHFHNGILNVDRKSQKPGIFSIFCRDQLVVENIVIADTPADIDIVIFPQTSVINKATPGRLFAQLHWKNVSQDMLHRLQTLHAVNCSVTYLEKHQSDPVILSFTDIINYESMSQGVIEIKCVCPSLGLGKKAVKLIHLRPRSVLSVLGYATFPEAVRSVAYDEQRSTFSSSRDRAKLLKNMGYFKENTPCIEPEGRLTTKNGLSKIQFMSVPPDKKVCAGFKADTTVYAPQSDIILVTVPRQIFYHFHQKRQVCTQFTTRNASEQVNGLLAKVVMNCSVYDSNNTLIQKSIECMDNGRHILNQLEERLLTDNYTFVCSNPSVDLYGRVTIPIVEQHKLLLQINGLNKMYHFIGDDDHLYVCLLVGLETGELLRERYKVKWRSLLSSRHVDVRENMLRVTNNTKPGPYKYQCQYNRNALNYYITVSFYVMDQAGISLKLRHAGQNVSQRVNPLLPVVICETGYLGGLVRVQPQWCRIHGDIPFTSKDRTDVVHGRSDLYIGNNTLGSATYACTVVGNDKQANKLFIVSMFPIKENAKIEPQKRLYMAESAITCEAEDLKSDLYEAAFSLHTDHYGVVQPNRRSIVWSSHEPLLESEGIAFVFCRTTLSYLGTVYKKSIKFLSTQIDCELRTEVGFSLRYINQGLFSLEIQPRLFANDKYKSNISSD